MKKKIKLVFAPAEDVLVKAFLKVLEEHSNNFTNRLSETLATNRTHQKHRQGNGNG